MNTGKILASVTILSLLLSSMGCGGSQSGQSSQQTDLIGGIGSALGIKQQKIDLLKKGVGVVQAMEPIGEVEEITLGEAVAVEAFSRFGGEYSNPAWTRYINLVGKTVAEVSDRPTLNYHFAILNSQEQNAFAAPGGYIFITVGLLKTLNNEAELAGVLAHEIAHVTQKHMLDAIRRGALMGSVSELSLTAMKQDPAMFSSVIDEMTNLLFTKGLDKDKEFEADVVGVGGEVDEVAALFEGGHLVADGFGGVGRGFFDGGAEFFEERLGGFGEGGDVVGDGGGNCSSFFHGAIFLVRR